MVDSAHVSALAGGTQARQQPQPARAGDSSNGFDVSDREEALEFIA